MSEGCPRCAALASPPPVCLCGRLRREWAPTIGPTDEARGWVLAPRDQLRTARERDVARLAPGVFAKLGFAPVPFAQPSALETMWVEITKRTGDAFEGTLANHPDLFPPEVLALEAPVEFRLEHVIVGRFQDPLPAPPPHACTTCGKSDEELAALLEGGRQVESKLQLLSSIRRFGWHVISVRGDEEGPPFSYTIGLFHTFRHPELIVVGLESDVAHDLLNHLGVEVSRGARLADRPRRNDLLEGLSVAVRPTSSALHGDLGFARWHYSGGEFPSLELAVDA